jgi:two-component system, LytTR family, sensor kinase
VPRPGRIIAVNDTPSAPAPASRRPEKKWLVWAISFAVWTVIAFFGAVTVTQYYRTMGTSMNFVEMLGLQLSQTLTYVPLTPFVFGLAMRYPLQRENWVRRSLMYLAGGVAFSVIHVAMRGLTPYAIWESKNHIWHSAIWDPHAHVFRLQWQIFRDLFFRYLADDISGTYVPILLVGHMVLHYRRSSEREQRASLLEAQLTKAKMQALKAQIQPHFLFNTLHSISSLMLSDVNAADKMMTRLSEMLRMSLEGDDGQITTLSRELEFVSIYLDIEKMRFGERLHVTFDIADNTLDAEIPHLLLQPLVENAVRHGVARMAPAQGEICLSCRQRGNSLIVSIADNGPGWGNRDTSRLGNGLGLRATRERLQTLYGSTQIFSITSLPREGTQVSIMIPFHATHEPATGEYLHANCDRG